MPFHVVTQIHPPLCREITLIALERPILRVRPHVHLQSLGRLAGVVAVIFRALVRPYLQMRHAVLGQIVSSLRGKQTFRTSVRSLVRMTFHVRL